MLNLAYRNLKIFFRDKSAVFFSFLGVLIVIGLYVLFLGDALIGEMNLPEAETLMDNWIMAGALAVTTITATLGAFGIMVEDRTKKNLKDFASAPLKKWQLTGGYIISTYIVGVLMSLFTLVLAETYIVLNGGELLNFVALSKVIGLILFGVFSTNALMMFIVSFFKSTNAFTAASVMIGTLSGFLSGVYLPVGQLAEPIAWVVKLFPVSHLAVLLRQVMMEKPLATSFEGLPIEAVTGFEEEMGIIFQFGDFTATIAVHLLVLASTAVIFYCLAIVNVSKKEK